MVGLSSREAKKRLLQYGPNAVETGKKLHVLLEYLLNFKNPMIIILIVVSIISLTLGEMINASLVLAMVVISTSLNFLQEHRASHAAEKLKNRLTTHTSVIRDGKEIVLPSQELVPGDVVLLNAGDLIAADAKLLDSKDLYVNQASLSGESFPVERHASTSENLVFGGTSVVSGTATAEVIATGRHTRLGAITKDLASGKSSNDFTRGIAGFSSFILRTVIIFVIVIFALNSFLKHDVLSSLTFSVAVAIGLTPEFLPMIMSVTMGRGSVRMSEKGVIVKRLTAIPTLGSMDILATDKTGTLTEDHVRLVRYLDSEGKDSEEVLKLAYLNSYFQTGLTNPLDTAVLEHKNKDFSHGYTKLDEIPFDFHRRRLSTVVKHGTSQLLICKGAPEIILSLCDHLPSAAHAKILKSFDSLSAQGFRVLAIATKPVNKQKSYSKADESHLTFAGLAAFLDPPKTHVIATIKELEALGIEIKIVTGDNELVTQYITSEIGIPSKGTLLGSEIASLDDKALVAAAEQHTVFARFSPEQKTRLITALQQAKHAVGFLGDGINDAPSLSQADVGISVENAVDIAKESADFILTHKSLEILKDGVVEGRKTFGNTLKYIMMGLSSNFGNMLSVLGAVLFLPFLPMLPLQILLNNFLYDLSQITIPSDYVDPDYVSSPKRWNINFIKNFMIVMGPISSLFDFFTYYLLFGVFHLTSAGFQSGWFMESLATQTLVIHIIRTRKIPFLQSRPHPALLLTTLAVVFIGWLIPRFDFARDFAFVSLSPRIVITLAGVVFLYLVSAELGKRLFYAANPEAHK